MEFASILFDLPKGENHPSASRLKLILAVLEAILKEPEQRGLGKRERAMLEELVLVAYRAVERVPYLSDLKQILDTHADFEMQKYGQILSSWVGASGYGKLLDGKSNIDLSKDLVTDRSAGTYESSRAKGYIAAASYGSHSGYSNARNGASNTTNCRRSRTPF